MNRRVDMIILGNEYKVSEDNIDGMESMDPLFPVDMPADMSGGQEGTAQ